MVRCDEGSPVETVDLAHAIDDWLHGVGSVDAVLGYTRADGQTWYNSPACGQ